MENFRKKQRILNEKNMQNQDIFTDVSQWWNSSRKKNTAAITKNEINLANRYRSDKTTADEMRIVFYCILVAATAVTVFLGYNYYLTVFTPISADWGWLISAALSLITEVGKCTLMLYVMYALLFGWFRQGWFKFFYYFMGLVLAVGTYWWSVHISTRGAEEFAIEKASANIPKDSLAALIGTATADIDRQIAAENTARNNAQGTKWKNTTTVQAQRTANTVSRTIETLQIQRAAITAQITEEYRSGLIRRGEKVNHLARFIRRSGGWLELATFLCICALALATVNLVRTRREENQATAQEAFT